MPIGKLSDIVDEPPATRGRLSDIVDEPPATRGRLSDIVDAPPPANARSLLRGLWEESGKPLVGPFTARDIALAGPLGGLAIRGGLRGTLAAANAVRKILGGSVPARVAEAVAPTGVNPYMKGPTAQPVRAVSMRDLIQPSPGGAAAAPGTAFSPGAMAMAAKAAGPAVDDAVAAARGAGELPQMLATARPAPVPALEALKPKLLSADFLRGTRAIEEVRSRAAAGARLQWPPSLSKLNPSKVPGLTESDVEYLRLSGFDATAPPTREALEALIQGRVIRTAAHRTFAERGGEEVLRRLRPPETGAIALPLLRTIGGASAGGALGASQNPDNPVLGGIAGATIGTAVANPMTTLRALNQLRHISMLSGLAPAKSLLNNIGAPMNAAYEMGSATPIFEALRLPTNVKNYAMALKAGTPYRGVEHPISRFNIFARQMGAADAATRAALERGGVTIADANRLLNQTTLEELGVGGAAARVLRGPGSAAYPYTRNAFNQFVHGLTPQSKPLAALYGGAGLATGSQTDDPISVGLLSAMAGPYALPFVAGAALSSGKANLFGQLSPLPEYGLEQLARNPLQQFEPALLRYLR